MRRPLPRAALALGAAVTGSPEYLARDAQNIAEAYGRRTAPDGQLSPEYGLASAGYINPVFAADLLAQAARRTGRRSRRRPPSRAGTAATPVAPTGTAPAGR